MWQRFTEKARRVVFYAQEEAQANRGAYVSTEHLLLGLLREADSTAAQVLEKVGLRRSRVQAEVKRRLTEGDESGAGDMTLTPAAKRVIDFAYDSARQLGDNYIGTEHLLLGLSRESKGIPAQVFKKLNVSLAEFEASVVEVQSKKRDKSGGAPAPTPRPATGATPRGQLVPMFARDAARSVGEGHVSTEHLLLALLRDPEAMASRILERLAITPEAVRAEIDRRTATYSGTALNSRTMPRVQRAVDLAREEMELDGAESIGTAHYLLALIREEHGIAAKALAKLGMTEAGVRETRDALRKEAQAGGT